MVSGLKRSVSLALIFLFLLIPFVYSQQVVQVQQEQQPKKAGFFSSTFGFLKSPIFWYVVIGLILFMILVICLFFLIRWIIKFLKSRSDIFWKLKNERIRLSKIQKRYPSRSWYKVHKNTPIRMVRNINGKITVSEPFAYHRGDYISHEGNVIISMNLKDNKKWLFFPITDLLVIPDKEKVDITSKDAKGKPTIITIDNLPRARDIIQFNENEILVYAENLSNMGMFYVPVLKAKDGKIIDLSMPVYQSLKEVVLGEYLFTQSDEFVKLSRQSMNLNPNLRYEVKSKDASSTAVEVPQRNG